MSLCSNMGVLAVISLLSATRVGPQVFVYEANFLPEDSGWEIVQVYCDPSQWVSASTLFQQVDLCPGDRPPGGQQAAYTRSLDEFTGSSTFFLEWRAETTADRSEIPWGGGAGLAAWSFGEVNYTFTIARDQVKLNRDNSLPIVFVDISPGRRHTHRLELYGSLDYTWYIDGQIVLSGIPEGPFPSDQPSITWLARAVWLANTTTWDYIRYGVIPLDASGDFDSNGAVDAGDVYFFLDCLLGPDAAGPGCRWSDMNGDGVANGDDAQQFAEALVGG